MRYQSETWAPISPLRSSARSRVEVKFLGGSWNHLECRITALRVRAAASGLRDFGDDDQPVPTAEIVATKISNPPIFSGVKALIVPRWSFVLPSGGRLEERRGGADKDERGKGEADGWEHQRETQRR